MVSGVKSRPSHYEVLGLSPAASDDEIGRAFIKKMSLFGAHPMDEAAQILIAYETLRNADKRRDYDASLGLGAKREPELRQWSFAVAPPRWSPLITSAAPNLAERGVERPSEPHVTDEPSLEALTAREAAPKPTPQREQKRGPGPDGSLEALVHHIREVGRLERESLRHAERRAPDWKKPVLAVSGLVLGAGLVGTLAGLSVTDNEAPAQAEPAATSTPPKHPSIAARPTFPVATAIDTQVERPSRINAPEFRAKRAERLRPSSWAERESLDLESASEDATAVAAQPAEAVAADMPLSSSLVAHTIDRIGYACGQVASTAPVEGEAPGVYKVTCSSGQSYQATPVHGRYRFRRLGGR
jgi:hypothetical protein